ncbi:MAG: PhzF family phenazine biosynthesis protein [Candidatus Bathyarchaeota archaeon]|nr:MAG: PhzF family phenazine biosynthesis protein [Candidatus Bathyarchaeota archaeon]
MLWERELVLKNDDEISFYIVDAFTRKPFRGNPAAVCLLQQQREDDVLQSIATEFNLSETAFLLNITEKPFKQSRVFALRWFTPKTEVPLCGHATLATATVIFHEFNGETSVLFKTLSGELTARREGDSIILDFPSEVTIPTKPNHNLLRQMGIREFEDAHLSKTSSTLLIQLKNEEILRSLTPNFDGMKSVSTKQNIDGVIVTSKGNPPYDFVSRFFAPWLGINEDPVTGSAHTILGPYWSNILRKQEMWAYQASARGGDLRVRVRKNRRVDLTGEAVIVSKGELSLSGYTSKDYSRV